MAEGAELARVVVVGTGADPQGPSSAAARNALGGARVVAGTKDQIDLWRRWTGPVTEGQEVHVAGDAAELVRVARDHVTSGTGVLCLLVSGDPGFFGITRALAGAMDRRRLTVLPAPPVVGLAFARFALPWDDALVVAGDGKAAPEVAGQVRHAPKAAVLAGERLPPEQLGRALVDMGASFDLIGVVSHPGTPDETARLVTLSELAGNRFPPASVVVFVGPGALPGTGWSAGPPPAGGSPPAPAALEGDQTRAWSLARPELAAVHATALLDEVSAVVVGALDLPATGVLWVLDDAHGDGRPFAGEAAPISSGPPSAPAAELAIACALLRPSLTVFAISAEARAAETASWAQAARAHVHVLTGDVPAILGAAPAPDRAAVLGAQPAALRAVLGATTPGGRVVAVTTTLDRALGAARLLGTLRQLTVAAGTPTESGEWVLGAREPVFVCSGPSAAGPDLSVDRFAS